MRVLIAHRWYGTGVPSGEDRAVEEDIRELLDLGIEVVCAMPEGSGPSLGDVGPASRFGRYSPLAVRRSGQSLLDRVQPDLVHLHNPYPEYLGLVRALTRQDRVPLVHTVHNYRHLCPAGSAFRDGHPCVDCSDERFPVSCVRHRCVNGGTVKSLAMAAMVRVGEPSIDAADLRIAISDHVRSWLLQTAAPGDGPVTVLHNAVADPSTSRGPPGTGDARSVRVLRRPAHGVQGDRPAGAGGAGPSGVLVAAPGRRRRRSAAGLDRRPGRGGGLPGRLSRAGRPGGGIRVHDEGGRGGGAVGLGGAVRVDRRRSPSDAAPRCW